MIETKEADRIGTAPSRLAEAISARPAPGFWRGVFMGWSRPSVHTTLLASTVAGRPAGSAYCSQVPTSPRAASGVGMVSSSSSQTRSGSCVSARWIPTAKPPAPPVFLGRRTTSSSVWCDRSASVPSVDALSTTTTRSSSWLCPASATSASSSSSRRFQVTTTPTTRVPGALVSGTREPYGVASADGGEVGGLVGGVPLLEVAEGAAGGGDGPAAVRTRRRGLLLLLGRLALGTVDRLGDRAVDQADVRVAGGDQGRDEGDRADRLAAGLHGQLHEPVDLALRQVGGDQRLAGPGDLLGHQDDGLRGELVEHRVHHALLPGHPGVVVGGHP